MRGRATDIESLPRVLAERYEVGRVLAQGGMGLVCLGRQIGLDREVAIKFIRPGRDATGLVLTRFKREAEVAKRLTHPNTVRLYDFGESPDGTLYLVMEHLKGRALDEELRANGPLSPRRVVHVGRQVLKSLIEAHALGIVHRDIKPSNLMLCDQIGEEDLVKVLDFGVASLPSVTQGPRATGTGSLVGTPAYMSPEQARGDAVDARSDLYSLGLTLLEASTGDCPVAGESPLDLAREQASDRPVPIPTGVAETPLGAVIRMAVAKDRGLRPASAEAMLRALERAAEVYASRERGDTLDEPPRFGHDSLPTTPDVSLTPVRDRIVRASQTDGEPAPRRGRRSIVALGAGLVAAAALTGALLSLGDPGADSPHTGSLAQAPVAPIPAVVPLSGGAERRLTNLPPENRLQFGDLSPDGQRFAYIDVHGVFWVQPIDGDEGPRRVNLPTQNVDWQFGWYPDGRHLLVNHGIHREATPMIRVDVETGATEVVHPEGAYARVSPDGRWIGFNGSQGVTVLPATGGEARTVVPGTYPGLYFVGWSPDGRWLTISDNTRGDGRLVAASVDGTESVEVVSEPRLGVRLAGTTAIWLGVDRVVYTRGYAAPDLGTELCEVAFPNTGADPICGRRWEVPVSLPSNPVGDRLIFERRDVGFDVYTVPLGDDGALAGRPVRVTRDQRPDSAAAWLDGDSLGTLQARGDRWRMLRYDQFGQEPVVLPDDPHFFATWAGTDGDGEPLIWRSRRLADGVLVGCELWRLRGDGRSSLVAELSGDRPCMDSEAPISARTGPSYDMRCRSSLCVLAEQLPAAVRFSELDLTVGRRSDPIAEQPDTRPTLRWDLSLDGQSIAFLDRAAGEIRLIPVTDPERRTLIVPPLTDSFWVAFDNTGRGVYVTGTASEEGYVMLHCDLAGACRTARSHQSTAMLHVHTSPDGRFLAYNVREMDTSLWLLEGF